MTKQQVEYLLLYESGYRVTEIAQMKNRSKTTVSRILKRARGKKCPFSPDCKCCPLPDCAINEKYVMLLNGRGNKRNNKNF